MVSMTLEPICNFRSSLDIFSHEDGYSGRARKHEHIQWDSFRVRYVDVFGMIHDFFHRPLQINMNNCINDYVRRFLIKATGCRNGLRRHWQGPHMIKSEVTIIRCNDSVTDKT